MTWWQVKLEAGAIFCIHLEAGTADGNTTRVSISNIFKAGEAAKGVGDKAGEAAKGVGDQAGEAAKGVGDDHTRHAVWAAARQLLGSCSACCNAAAQPSCTRLPGGCFRNLRSAAMPGHALPATALDLCLPPLTAPAPPAPPPRAQTKRNTVQLALPRQPTKWVTLAVDLQEAVKQSSSSPFEALKSVQLCCKLAARGLFTSDIKFGPKVGAPCPLIKPPAPCPPPPPARCRLKPAAAAACHHYPQRPPPRPPSLAHTGPLSSVHVA